MAEYERKDWAAAVSAEILHYIDTEGTVPWSKGWVTDGIFPSNPVSGWEYRGINNILLGIYQQIRGYSTPYYCTVKQMASKGGKFIADAKGQGLPVLFWSRITKEDKDTGKTKTFGFWKGYTVFSLDLMEGITTPSSDRPEPFTPSEAVASLEAGYTGGPTIRWIDSAQAYYTPSLHQITLPKREQFTSEIAYAETLSHELCHSTGHESLMDRDLKGWACQQDYAKEELVAEIGAAITMQRMGLQPEMRSMAAYVKGWRNKISDDPKLIVSAASKADHASRMVLGITADTKEEAA